MYRKYHNKKITIDGLTFDSKKEARRYQELKALEKAGVIYGLQTQVKYLLIPAQHELTDEVYIKGKNKGTPKKGKLLEHECAYYADLVKTKKSDIFMSLFFFVLHEGFEPSILRLRI